jgi:hypothetical protein
MVGDRPSLEERLPLLPTVTLNQRKTITPKQWSALTPYFIDLHNEREIAEIVPLLAHLSTMSGGAAPHEPRIIVYGHGDKSPLGFPNPDALIDFIENGVVKNRNRYHYTQNKNADIIVLSRDGLAFGHFEIINKEQPDAQDSREYPPVKCVYVVGARASYTKPVQLFPILKKQVTSFGLPISAVDFDRIKMQAGQIREFRDTELTRG